MQRNDRLCERTHVHDREDVIRVYCQRLSQARCRALHVRDEVKDALDVLDDLLVGLDLLGRHPLQVVSDLLEARYEDAERVGLAVHALCDAGEAPLAVRDVAEEVLDPNRLGLEGADVVGEVAEVDGGDGVLGVGGTSGRAQVLGGGGGGGGALGGELLCYFLDGDVCLDGKAPRGGEVYVDDDVDGVGDIVGDKLVDLCIEGLDPAIRCSVWATICTVPSYNLFFVYNIKLKSKLNTYILNLN